ncbi:polysaccharide deacetylase family protein [Psychrobacillus sp.]|uniref:polysaccharide deacetylase family protein n=1 Tax=Psychrobacillus sp. TaxID=1871623 RepID=UPI0028BE5B6D|nr:polysaccharide deacetylase family protein [Psychrobacillus sp.]
MSVYLGKLLELVSIETESNQSFLRLKLTSDQEIELLWEIDHDTAKNLMAVTELGGSHKYRLSFHSFWDSTKDQNSSFLTKTYRDQSEKVFFTCSRAYVNGLKAIKHDEQLSQIKFLAPIAIHQHPVKDEVVTSPSLHRKFAWTAVTCASILTIVLFSTLLLPKEEMNDNSTVKAEGISEEIVENVIVDIQTEVSSSTNIAFPEPTLPFVGLTEVVNFSIPEGNVALTFDDGPSKYTKEITDILKEYQVGGTFFFIGKNVAKHPDSVQYVKSNDYSIGSHSMNHLLLTKLSAEKQAYDLLHTNKLIEDIIQEKVVLFRPPYGAKNAATIELMNKTQSKMVLWNTDTEDWKSQNAEKIFQYVLNSKASGSIILLHESQVVVDVLPRIIEHLQQQNLKIVNLN